MEQQIRRQFFSESNQNMLYGMLTKNFQQRIGAQLNEKQATFLVNSLEHHMGEIIQRAPNQPVQLLNKTAIADTATEFNAYMQRQASLVKSTPQTFQDTSRQYEQAQQDRQRSLEAPRPNMPDYIQPIQLKEDDSISAIALFEDAKKRRANEMEVQAEADNARRAVSATKPLYLETQQSMPNPRVLFDQPLDMVLAGRTSGRADVNPTIAGPTPGQDNRTRGPLPQDMLIRQQDIQTYIETEYNLSVYSADRKWEIATTENRFNFSVNLYSGNPTNGISIMPKATARFRNIVRIEFVKAIMPIDNTDMVVQKTSATLYSSDFLKDIFGYPFVTLNVEELDTNNFGTNNTMDNAFALLQYDANWTDNTQSMGFTSFIPKFMKCQRVYSPTPLASLSKLTIRLQQPNGNLISSAPDTFDLSGVFLSTTVSAYMNTATVTGTFYADTSGEFIWIDTKRWFSRYQIAAGDRIQMRNLSIATPTAAQTDLINFLQDPSGLMVVATAFSVALAGPSTSVNTNWNSAGYARFIIVRNRFRDPTTGSTAINPFGLQANNSALASSLIGRSMAPGRLINLSRQTQLIFRIITRDYDSTSLVRPDNL
jgi:hypothetical protein